MHPSFVGELMRILQVCSASEMGGGEVHVADLSRALAGRGHAVYLAVRPGSPLREALNGPIASWHEFPLRNSLDLGSARAITELVNRHRIEIVHAHVGRDYLISALACRGTPEARLLLTRHHYFPLKRNALHRWMLDRVSAVIAVSDSVRDSVIERLALPPERVHVIPNWIDPDRFRPFDRAAARSVFKMRGALVVACIGRITPAKGQEEFIRAAARVARSRGDVEFVIAGDEQEPDQPFTRRLGELAKTLGVGERVRFLGHVRFLPEFLAAVDVVVVPSWNEGFSLVTLESMAARKPVLASNVGGIKSIVAEGANGMLFTARDERAMADKLIWLLADGPLRERLAAQAQHDAHTRFGRDRIVDRIEALYEKILGVGVESD